MALKLWSQRLAREFPGTLTERLVTALTEAVAAINAGQDLQGHADRAWDQLQEWMAQASEVAL